MSGPFHGLLLAAGAGRRMGMPKGLVIGADGEPWVCRGVRVLRDGGCDEVTVVVGAEAERVRSLVADDPSVRTAYAADWQGGMSASLAVGLAALAMEVQASVAVVLLVDLPDVDETVVRRVVEAAGDSPRVLARAAYDGLPGHPVLIGRDHWGGVLTAAAGDHGARAYLAAHDPLVVECGDLATGADVDRPI